MMTWCEDKQNTCGRYEPELISCWRGIASATSSTHFRNLW